MALVEFSCWSKIREIKMEFGNKRYTVSLKLTEGYSFYWLCSGIMHTSLSRLFFFFLFLFLSAHNLFCLFCTLLSLRLSHTFVCRILPALRVPPSISLSPFTLTFLPLSLASSRLRIESIVGSIFLLSFAAPTLSSARLGQAWNPNETREAVRRIVQWHWAAAIAR